jgi:hypothetical protein
MTDIIEVAGGIQIIEVVEGGIEIIEVCIQGPPGADGATDHGALTGLSDDDHSQYHTDARGDARYSALDHDHPGVYDAAGTAATAINTHELDPNPHPVYLTDAEGDAAYSALTHDHASTYAPIAKGVTNGDSHDHFGGDGAQIAYSTLSGLPTLGTASEQNTSAFEAAGAIETHAALTTSHGISAFGASLIDDADASAARTTLGLGTAATTATTAYATSAQGSTADSAIQPGDDAADLGSGAASDGYVLTADGAGGAAWETAAVTYSGAASEIHAAASKTTPVDADELPLIDSAASWVLKKLTWANLKASVLSAFGITSTHVAFSNGSTLIGDDGLTWDNVNKTLIISNNSQVATLGSELLTNNEFATDLSGWTGSNWSWNSGSADPNESIPTLLTQTLTEVVANCGYRFVITVTGGRTAGYVQASFGGAASGVTHGDGVYSFYLFPTSGGTQTFSLLPVSSFNGLVGSVSLKRIYEIQPILKLKNSLNPAVEIRGDSTLNNVSIGAGTAKYNIDGVRNTCIGVNALAKAVSSYDNVAIGFYALPSGSTSVAIGSGALGSNSLGLRNTAIGYNSLSQNTTGVQNTAIGYRSLGSANSNRNTAIGDDAMYSKTSGNDNVAVGALALRENVSGTNNIAIGSYAGYYETGSYKLYIESSNSSSPLIYGEFNNRMVRINGMLYARKTTEQLRLEYDATNYVSATVSSAGNLTLDTTGGTIYTPDTIENTVAGAGIVLKSPDGTRYRITVANGGTLSIAAA